MICMDEIKENKCSTSLDNPFCNAYIYTHISDTIVHLSLLSKMGSEKAVRKTLIVCGLQNNVTIRKERSLIATSMVSVS